MGAKVVDTSLKASSWTSKKPPDYKGKALEDALKKVEGIDLKKVAMPAKLPTVPKPTISEIEACITQTEADIITLQKALAEIRKLQSALQAVSSAASATSAELQKMAKDKKASEDQKNKYNSAAQTASFIGINASAAAKSLE